ncbi:hypothetical protein BDV06DRAFT_230777 [Aspergillus oleicola]
MENSRYITLPMVEDSQHSIPTKVSRAHQRWKYILLPLASLLYIYPFVFTIRNYHSVSAPRNYAQTNSLRTVWKPLHWNTEYSPQNHSDADALWDAINAAHGIIAVDRAWAGKQNWPGSMALPDDASKGVYLLEAYHQLHCLKILRLTFWEAVDGRPYTHHPSRHMEHCFDYLRQVVQCNADNTPLYTFGAFRAGDGQVHECRDWNELHDYAKENSACYRDSVVGIPLKEHFGFCEGAAVDGLEGANG